MRLYDGGRAPNPRRVRVFLKEKGITVPIVPVDLGAMEHRSDHYAAVNPLRLVPALELDDGTVITEIIAICRYFEAFSPIPPCSAPIRSKSRWWKCGSGGSSCISWPGSSRYSGTSIPA